MAKDLKPKTVTFPHVGATEAVNAVAWMSEAAPKLRRVKFTGGDVDTTEEIIDEPKRTEIISPRDLQMNETISGGVPSFDDSDSYDEQSFRDDGFAPSDSNDDFSFPSASQIPDAPLDGDYDRLPSLSIPPAGMPPSLSSFPDGPESSAPSVSPAAAPQSQQSKEAFARAAIELAAARHDLVASAEAQLLELAVAIAQSIVEREIEVHPELHGTLARAAIKTLNDVNGATLRASREAYGAIVDVFNEPFVSVDGTRVKVQLDPTIEGLGVVAENAHMRVDGRLSERLRSVMRALEEARRSREEEEEEQQ